MAKRPATERLRGDGVHPAGSETVVAGFRRKRDSGQAVRVARRRERSLRRWLIASLLLALLPIGAVNLFQGVTQLTRDTEEASRRLYQSALTVAADEKNILAGAEHLLRSLAAQNSVREGRRDSCEETLASATSGLPYFTNVARLDAEGRLLCAARPVELTDITSRPWWDEIRHNSDFFLSEQVFGDLSQSWNILAILPIFSGPGEFRGALVLAIDIRWLDALVRGKDLPSDTVVALLDRTHRIIAANQRQVAYTIFRKTDESDTSQPEPELLTGYDSNGDAWVYAVAPIVRNDFLVAFAMRRGDLFGWTYLSSGINLGLPLVMIILSCGVMWLATHRLVLRWIDLLRRIARAYEKGHYRIRPVSLEEAPLELKQLGETLYTMGDAVRDRNERLQKALEYKAASIREIHHRVKNNLQVVMSLLSLQAMRMHEQAASEALEQARMRVNALALVHSILQDVENADEVDIRRLLEELARQIHSGLEGDSSRISLELDLAPITLLIDQATPLALFVVEALTNVYKHAWEEEGPDNQLRLIRVLLRREGEHLSLSVVDNGKGYRAEGEGSGTKLMRAFAQQLGGTLTLEAGAGGGTVARLEFPQRNAAFAA